MRVAIRYFIKMLLCIWSLSMYMIFIYVYDLYHVHFTLKCACEYCILSCSNVSNLWTIVETQVARIPTIRAVATCQDQPLSALRFDHNAHGDKTLNRPLARLWECSQSGGQNKRNFRFCKKIVLFCTQNWLHFHRRARGHCRFFCARVWLLFWL